MSEIHERTRRWLDDCPDKGSETFALVSDLLAAEADAVRCLSNTGASLKRILDYSRPIAEGGQEGQCWCRQCVVALIIGDEDVPTVA